MTNAIPVILVLALACLFAFSTALPSILNQIMSPQAEPNAPRTLLGKPYRKHLDSQGCPPSCWIHSFTDHDHADHASAYQALPGGNGWIQTEAKAGPRVQLSLPLVPDVFPGPVPARLRLMKSKRPSRYSPCSDDAPLSSRARSDGTTLKDEDAQLPIVSRPDGETEPREVPTPVRRSKRLYGRGLWKSRLLEEY